MTNYYIEKNNKIIFTDTDLERLQNTIALGEYASLEIKETERPIVNFEFVDTPEYLAKELEQAKKAKQAEQKAICGTLLQGLYKNINIDDKSMGYFAMFSSKILLNIVQGKPPLVINFGDNDNVYKDYTQEEFIGLIEEIGAYKTTLEQRQSEIAVAIDNAKTMEELNVIDISYEV